VIDGDGKPIPDDEWYWVKTSSDIWQAGLSYISDNELQWWLWGMDYPINEPSIIIGSHIERPV
jgi:hypothetical protein